METLSSSAELAAGATSSNPTTGMSDARRPKLPTRTKPRATVNSPAYNTTLYSIHRAYGEQEEIARPHLALRLRLLKIKPFHVGTVVASSTNQDLLGD